MEMLCLWSLGEWAEASLTSGWLRNSQMSSLSLYHPVSVTWLVRGEKSTHFPHLWDVLRCGFTCHVKGTCRHRSVAMGASVVLSAKKINCFYSVSCCHGLIAKHDPVNTICLKKTQKFCVAFELSCCCFLLHIKAIREHWRPHIYLLAGRNLNLRLLESILMMLNS